MQESEIIKNILEGKIFIYPTDTIYGLGCDATNKESVEKIKSIKSRDKDKPLSVIAPSFKWIEDNLHVDLDLKKYLPGPYTIILKKKDSEFLNFVSSLNTLGLRMPDYEFCTIVQKSKRPFITTSVNLSGEPFLADLKDLKKEIKDKVHFIIDAGVLKGRPSTIISSTNMIKR